MKEKISQSYNNIETMLFFVGFVSRTHLYFVDLESEKNKFGYVLFFVNHIHNILIYNLYHVSTV